MLLRLALEINWISRWDKLRENHKNIFLTSVASSKSNPSNLSLQFRCTRWFISLFLKCAEFAEGVERPRGILHESWDTSGCLKWPYMRTAIKYRFLKWPEVSWCCEKGNEKKINQISGYFLCANFVVLKKYCENLENLKSLLQKLWVSNSALNSKILVSKF